MNFFEWLKGLFHKKEQAMDENSKGSGASNNQQSMPEPKNTSVRLIGVDVSHHNGAVDWAGVKKSCAFASAKATESTTFPDPMLEAHKKGAKLQGLIFSPYHFLRFDHSGVDQADFFLSKVGSLDAEDFPCLDWEVTVGAGDLKVGRDFLERVKAKTKRRCVIYINYYIAKALQGDVSFLAEYPLWVPNYSHEPQVPAPWKRWDLWQDSESASLPGVSGHFDRDIFRGDIQDFRELVKWTVL